MGYLDLDSGFTAVVGLLSVSHCRTELNTQPVYVMHKFVCDDKRSNVLSSGEDFTARKSPRQVKSRSLGPVGLFHFAFYAF
jgi:hypothetical protein